MRRRGSPTRPAASSPGATDRVEQFFPAESDEPSPFYYRIEARDQIRIMNEIDDAGLDLIGHLPLAHELAGLPVAHRRRAGLLAGRGLRDRVARGRGRPTCAATASAKWTITEEALRFE